MLLIGSRYVLTLESEGKHYGYMQMNSGNRCGYSDLYKRSMALVRAKYKKKSGKKQTNKIILKYYNILKFKRFYYRLLFVISMYVIKLIDMFLINFFLPIAKTPTKQISLK